ncbi:hypothetical protein [Mucilaginibacter sp.]|jgi:hypothetical protein|uniref:hypothetical protein n=1 Tax=Mucilaginibacter sp. TaxID=1882438 RepID=UPI002605AA54|nr:hypothetical protein [Mucilaginibacter sp.]MDB4919387.1 hypothetical protein [Mucilaginibacter sp.]
MTIEEAESLETELINYVADVGIGKDFTKLSLAIRGKIDEINALIDLAIGNDMVDDFKILVSINYQYYKLMYG